MIISVIVPVYNADRFLMKAVDSVVRQTLSDFELIAVDDGSTDGSLAILQDLASKDRRVQYISRPNTGIVGALNDGLAMARGKYLARMDADDLCDPRRFELQVARLEREPDLVALGSCAIAIDPDGELLGPAPVPLTHEEIEANHLKGQTSIYHPAVMIRADALRKVGGYREGTCPCEDYDLWLRLGEVGRLANLSEPLFTWRRTTTGIVASNVHRMQEALATVLADAWQRRGLSGQPPRIEPDTTTRADLYRQWSWKALKSGGRSTARRYALKALRTEPWSPASWRLAACVARGY